MATPPTMSEVLRQVVIDSGLPLLRIEKDTGIQRASLSRFIRGETSLRLDLADRLARYFGLTLTPTKRTPPARGKPKGK